MLLLEQNVHPPTIFKQLFSVCGSLITGFFHAYPTPTLHLRFPASAMPIVSSPRLKNFLLNVIDFTLLKIHIIIFPMVDDN